jgi:hypothetical protein
MNMCEWALNNDRIYLFQHMHVPAIDLFFIRGQSAIMGLKKIHTFHQG